jgi:hypothetical protein
MACYWGQTPARVTRYQLLAWAALVAMLGFASTGCADRAGTRGVRVDHAVGVIYIDRSIPSHFSICDGPDGSCLPVSAIRELSRRLR